MLLAYEPVTKIVFIYLRFGISNLLYKLLNLVNNCRCFY